MAQRTHEWRIIVAIYGQAEGLRGKLIVSTHVDTTGRLWVGSEGGGLAVWRDNAFFSFGPAQGVDAQTVNEILNDGKGRLWLAGNRGTLSLRFSDLEAVLRGEKQRVSPEWLGKSPNSIPAPFPAMAPVKTSDGRLAFGTSRGFALIQPPPLLPWPTGPQVRIEKVMLLGQPMVKNSARLTLPPDARHFEVFWSAPSLKWAENMSFHYRLKGVDEDWHEVGNQRRAVFAGLAPGDYVLELASRIGNGPWSEKLTRLNITAVPVIWQNWWFRGSAAFAAAGLDRLG